MNARPANQSRQELHPFVDASPQARSTPSLPHNENDTAAENIGAGFERVRGEAAAQALAL